MAELVTLDNFARAETAHYFKEQLTKAPVNQYFHNRIPVNVENQVIIRSNVDLIYSYAVVDLTKGATFSVAPSDDYRSTSSSTRTTTSSMWSIRARPRRSPTTSSASGTTSTSSVERPRAAGWTGHMSSRTSAGSPPASADAYVGIDYDEDSRHAIGAELQARSAEADFSKGFGTPESTEPFQHTLAARLGWGGLPPEHAQYFQALATSTGCDVWTFDVPPLDFEHNGYFSVIKYDDMGWIDVGRPCLPDREIRRNHDGTISICFGDDRASGEPNVIETTEGQRFYYGIRLYRPRDVEETVAYIDRLRGAPIQPCSG